MVMPRLLGLLLLLAGSWPAPRAAGAEAQLQAAAPGQAEPRPPARVACGEYEAVSTGVVRSRATRLLLQRKGRVLTTVTDYAIAGVSCADLTGSGKPELLARTFSGGAHCCETVRVWSLGTRPRLILEYAAGNAGGAVARDADGDGRTELLLGDDGLAYFDDLDYASSPSSLPLVACFDGEGFRDCSTEHPAVLREAGARFRERLRPSPGGGSTGHVRGDALGLFAVALLLGEEEQAREAIRAGVGDEKLLAWLERVTPRLRVWAEARGRKLKRPGS